MPFDESDTALLPLLRLLQKVTDHLASLDETMLNELTRIGDVLHRIDNTLHEMSTLYARAMEGELTSEPPDQDEVGEGRAVRSLVGSFGETPRVLNPHESALFSVKVPKRGRLTLNRIVLSVRPRELVPYLRLYEVAINTLRVREPLLAPEPMKSPPEGAPAPEHQLVSASFFDAGYPHDAPVLVGGETLAVELRLDGQAPGPAYVTVGYVVDTEIPPG